MIEDIYTQCVAVKYMKWQMLLSQSRFILVILAEQNISIDGAKKNKHLPQKGLFHRKNSIKRPNTKF